MDRRWHRDHRGIVGVSVVRRLAVVIACALLFAPVARAQQAGAPGFLPFPMPSTVTIWTCGLNALAATLTQCQAAPAAGLKLYLTDITVQTTTTTSGTYAIQTGTGTNCATGTAALFPVSGTANRWNAPITTQAASNFKFGTPLSAPAAAAICVIGVATNTIAIQLQGFTAP